jgi:hypothetical protein
MNEGKNKKYMMISVGTKEQDLILLYIFKLIFLYLSF